MERYEIADAAGRIGTTIDDLRRLIDLGILKPGADDRWTSGDVRRASLVGSLVAAGISLDGLGAAMRSGQVSFDFLDAPAFERFSAYSGVTFAEFAERREAPVQLPMLIREAAGSPAPAPDDRLRDEELPHAEMIATAFAAGMRPAAIQQLVRVQGDGLRRMAETESAIWQSEIIGPAMASGRRMDESLGGDLGDRMSLQLDAAVLGMYHLQQAQAWSTDIIAALEMQLAAAGLHGRLEHPPAMCFLDITGYTRLTQERGDAAAAQLAEQLGRIVQRTAVAHGGRAVKWLGDGVMLHFPNPGQGVAAALEMVDGVIDAGLPPAHVGLHAGPVIFQEGDYYGQTVNLAARIAAYAQAGEVIVSQAVIDSSGEADVAFRAVGPVKLKGVAGATDLYEAQRPT